MAKELLPTDLAVRHGPARALLHTSLLSIMTFSPPRKGLGERDIIISSFGMDANRISAEFLCQTTTASLGEHPNSSLTVMLIRNR